MKELKLHHYIDPQQRGHWPAHDVLFFDHKNYVLYRTNAMTKFCEEFGLINTKMSALIAGRIKSHKGLTVWKFGAPTTSTEHYFN